MSHLQWIATVTYILKVDAVLAALAADIDRMDLDNMAVFVQTRSPLHLLHSVGILGESFIRFSHMNRVKIK